MKIAIIILNWNSAADTISCLSRIAEWRHLQAVVWVVDNASTDGSAETIARDCPHVRLVRNPTNLGFAGGNNQAIRAALALGDAPILLLNSDAFIEEEDVARLFETLESNQQLGLIGPLLLDADRRTQLLAAGGRNPVLHHHSHILKPGDGAPVHIVEYVPGTVLLVRAEVFRTVGFLDEDYFFNMEVADLCMRARRHGYLSAVDTRARAFHDLGRSSGLRETLYAYYIIRNRFIFIRKFYRLGRLPLYGFWTLYSLALSLKLELNGKSSAGRAIRLGLFDGLGGRFGGQNECVLSYCGQSPNGMESLQ